MEQRNRGRIPKFGSWDSSDAPLPFTEVFEEARAARGGSGSSEAEILAGRLRNGHPYKVNPTKHVRRASKEEEIAAAAAAQRRQIEPPAYRVIDETRYVPQAGGENELFPRVIAHSQSAHENGSVGRVVVYPESSNNVQSSPARGNGNRSSGSPAWEKVARPASEGSSTPGRSRLRNSNNSTEPAEALPALPKFGAWDANDPASADGFTVIFNNARNEKKTGGSIHVPPIGLVDKDLYPQRDNATGAKSSTRKFFCCFQPGQGVQA